MGMPSGFVGNVPFLDKMVLFYIVDYHKQNDYASRVLYLEAVK